MRFIERAPVAPTRFNPDIPPKLEEIINKALDKDRELRYQNAADMRADLKRVRARDCNRARTPALEVGEASPTAPSASGSALRVASAYQRACSFCGKQRNGSCDFQWGAAGCAFRTRCGPRSAPEVAVCMRGSERWPASWA